MIITENQQKKAIDGALMMLYFAQAKGSGSKVGACLIAENFAGNRQLYHGCNIEIAQSKNWHAEEVALVKAISEGYTKPIACVVTSTNKLQQAAMCGYCMQHYSYVNQDCLIIVVDLEGNIIKQTDVKSRQGEHGYLSTGYGLS